MPCKINALLNKTPTKNLWIISSRQHLHVPKEDMVLLLGEAATIEGFEQHTAFVDAEETPSHTHATPLNAKQVIALVFSATKVLHG